VARKKGAPGRRAQLHRAVSKLGWGSRGLAWGWIVAGRVRVDGRVVTDPLAWVDLDRQHITLAGAEPPRPAPVVLALHKPRGVVTTRRDERGRRTVYDLLPAGLPWVFPAGRLDADSEGLLIVTNDSALAERLTRPEGHVPKAYRATVRGRVGQEALERLRRGVDLADGPTRPAEARLVEAEEARSIVEVILTEGRNRQVRRMLAAVGHKVRRLVRVAIGGLELGELRPGEWRELGEEERALLVGGPGP
jgi:pseudouridine synthase